MFKFGSLFGGLPAGGGPVGVAFEVADLFPDP